MINLDKTQMAHYKEARRTPVIRYKTYYGGNPYDRTIYQETNEWHPASKCFDAAKNLYTYAWKDNAKWDRDKKNDEKKAKEMTHQLALAQARDNPVVPCQEVIGYRAQPMIERGNHEGNSNHLLDHLAYIVTAIENGKFVLTVTGNNPFNLSCKDLVYTDKDRHELKTVTLASTHYKKDDLKGAKYTFDSILLLDAEGKVIAPPKHISIKEPINALPRVEKILTECKKMIASIPEIRKEDAAKPNEDPSIDIDKAYLNAIIDKNWTLAEQLHRQKLAA